MVSSEKFVQLKLGGDFVIGEEKKLKHENAPEGSTHFIEVNSEIFFYSDPDPMYRESSYGNSYKVKKQFYAEMDYEEKGWGYFRIKGIDKDTPYAVLHIRGKTSGPKEGNYFKVKMSRAIKIK